MIEELETQEIQDMPTIFERLTLASMALNAMASDDNTDSYEDLKRAVKNVDEVIKSIIVEIVSTQQQELDN
jgi:hypothetical protein